jgi:general stress protein YciG
MDDEERGRPGSGLRGKTTPPEKRAFSKDRELARRAGKKGGEASAAARDAPHGSRSDASSSWGSPTSWETG